ncbi:OmpA family protein [Pontiellaceae bacterium B12227]|nr:OmpA family protein [Pontiellaceae bacterium B12227]
MKNVIFKLFVFVAVASSLAFIGGCRSKNANDADLYGSDNLYGDPLMGDMPLNDIDGLPADGDRSVVDPVFFAYDSSQVNPEEAGKCEEVAQLLKKGKYQGVISEGHGDERGSREYNLALGERRALAVRDYLISLGVDPTMVQTKSMGEEMPSDMGHDEGAWRKNRRVEFALY